MYISFGLDFWCVNRYDADKVESNMQAVENLMRTNGNR
ncbi:hypothetical protein M798_02540 [Brucella melitensis ADMAS-G1]|nr:hypothetical protein M798_02540 [Brucella melitensis ADMAS-G1]